MSESSRLLITAGCSFTCDLNINIKNNIMHWGRLVSHEMGLDLVNVSMAGASNSYIENAVTDAIVKYHHRDPLIMVLWSGPKRINVNDCGTLFPQSVDDYGVLAMGRFFKEYDTDDWNYMYVKASLRSIWRTEQLAKQHNLRIVNILGCWQAPGYKNRKKYQNTLSKIQKDWYYNELDIDMRQIENGVFDDIGVNVIPIDDHPNQEGHYIIAEMFMKEHDKHIKEKEFIYE